MKRHRWFLAAVLFAVLGLTSVHAQQAAGSAAEQASRFAPVAPGETLPNLDKLKDELRQYHDCTGAHGCYTRDLDLEADRAIAFLRRRAAHARPGEKLAMVLDIDETTLSNWEEMRAADFAYNSAVFNAWVDSAKAPAIPATLRLYRAAQQLGVNAIFLTGRAASERAATERNLRGVGFDGWTELILRQPAEAHLTALEYKSARRAKVAAEGYRIVLNVGDQWSDLRGMPEAEYSVKYPDPFYFLK